MGSFGISEGNITGGEPTDYAPTVTPSGEVVQMLASASSEWGLNTEAQAALLRVRTGPECLEDKLRELM